MLSGDARGGLRQDGLADPRVCADEQPLSFAGRDARRQSGGRDEVAAGHLHAALQRAARSVWTFVSRPIQGGARGGGERGLSGGRQHVYPFEPGAGGIDPDWQREARALSLGQLPVVCEGGWRRSGLAGAGACAGGAAVETARPPGLRKLRGRAGVGTGDASGPAGIGRTMESVAAGLVCGGGGIWGTVAGKNREAGPRPAAGIAQRDKPTRTRRGSGGAMAPGGVGEAGAEGGGTGERTESDARESGVGAMVAGADDGIVALGECAPWDGPLQQRRSGSPEAECPRRAQSPASPEETGNHRRKTMKYQNPRTDPSTDGECPWCIGAALGALSNLGLQLILNHGNFSCVNWTDVGLSAVQGALGLGALKNLREAYKAYSYLKDLEKVDVLLPTAFKETLINRETSNIVQAAIKGGIGVPAFQVAKIAAKDVTSSSSGPCH